MSSTWRHVWLLWLCGVVAAAEFGKFGPLLTLLAHDRGFSLPAAGWLSSIIELGGATCGLLGGRLVRGLGSRRAIQSGLMLLILGSAAEFALGGIGLWLGRVIESAGYLLVVVSAPSLMMQLTTDRERPHAMSLWSTFVPVGLAIGSIVSGTLAPSVGLSVTLAAWAAFPCLVVVLTLYLPHPTPGDESGDMPTRRPSPAIWWLCATFGCYAVMFVGVVALLPTFLQTTAHLSTAVSGAVGGTAAFATVAGSAITSWRLRRDHARFSFGAMRDLYSLGLALPALLLAWLYWTSSHPVGHPILLVGVPAIVAVAFSGIVAAVLFARISHASHQPHEAHPAVVNGLLTHFGAAGSLVGPPILAFITTRGGWPAAAVFVVVLSLGTLGLALAAQHAAHPRGQAGENGQV